MEKTNISKVDGSEIHHGDMEKTNTFRRSWFGQFTVET